MENTEEKLQKATQIFREKYAQWLSTQEGQKDGYQFEASFDAMINQVNHEVFQVGVEQSVKESKKK